MIVTLFDPIAAVQPGLWTVTFRVTEPNAFAKNVMLDVPSPATLGAITRFLRRA